MANSMAKKQYRPSFVFLVEKSPRTYHVALPNEEKAACGLEVKNTRRTVNILKEIQILGGKPCKICLGAYHQRKESDFGVIH